MFWKYNNSSPSQIEALLSKENITLKEIMDEEDIINECKMQTKALIDYLSKPEIMQELVNLTTAEPPPDLEERIRFKYPNIACELLTCDVPALNERLAGDQELLAKLYNFLDSEPPLNPLLASFFSKIMGVLITKKTEQVLDFLKAKENLITLLLNHLGTSAIMDLILKLMTQVEEGVERQNILNWLDSQRIIQSLVALFNPQIDMERHYNVAQLLCDFIKIARDNQQNLTERNDPDPLLNTLESPDTVSLLLDEILNESKCESAIVGGIQVLLALLDVHRTSIPKYETQSIYTNTVTFDEGIDVEHRQKVTQSTTKVILKRLKDFHNLLLDPPQKKPICTTFGVLEPPLGNTRLQIIKLIASIIITNDMDILQELITLETFKVLLDLFFKFPWNNFLHTQVQTCIISALKVNFDTEKGDLNALHEHLLVNCKLIERILDAWKKNEETEAQDGVRQGYMGHLINIANELVDLCSKTSLGQYLNDILPEVAESFKVFKETKLLATNKTQEILLGGVHPNSAADSNDEFNDLSYVQAGVSPQQMFVHYQMQQIASKFPETFGFNDNDFNDGDDTLPTINRITAMNFDLFNDDFLSQCEVFKQVCAQSINTLALDDEDDQIFEDRDQTFQTVIEKTSKRHNTVYGSDSDDDSQSPAEPSNADPWSSPKEGSEAPGQPSTDPWSVNQIDMNETNANWADFSSASFGAFDNRENRIGNNVKVDSVDNKKDGKCNVEAKTKSEEIINMIDGKKEVAAGDQGEASRHSTVVDVKVVQLPNLALEGDSTNIAATTTTTLLDVNNDTTTTTTTASTNNNIPDDNNDKNTV